MNQVKEIKVISAKIFNVKTQEIILKTPFGDDMKKITVECEEQIDGSINSINVIYNNTLIGIVSLNDMYLSSANVDDSNKELVLNFLNFIREFFKDKLKK